MTARRRRRWFLAKVKREARESWFWHVGLVRSMTWPFRDPHTWWYYRRVKAAIRRGHFLLAA